MHASLQPAGPALLASEQQHRRPVTPGSDASAPRGADTAPVNRLMACMAGFFHQEAEALAAVQQLTQVHGLRRTQQVLLRPADASSWRFERGARQWAGSWQTDGRPPRAGHWRQAGLGLLLSTLLLAAWWLPEWRLPDDWFWSSLGAAALLGVGLIAFGGPIWRKVPRPRRFDQRVRDQLAGGAWAVVVHGVPWDRQAGVVALLRGSSLTWCGEAAPAQRI